MVDRGLEELRDVLGKLAVGGVVEPAEFRYATDELDEAQGDEVLQRRSVVREVPQDVIPYVYALGDREVVPVRRDQLRQAVRRHQQGVLGFGPVEDVLALGDERRRRLEAQESRLRLLARYLLDPTRAGLAGVQRLA